MNGPSIIKSVLLGALTAFIGYQLVEHIIRVERVEAKIDQLLYLVDNCDCEDEEVVDPLDMANSNLPVFKLPVQ